MFSFPFFPFLATACAAAAAAAAFAAAAALIFWALGPSVACRAAAAFVLAVGAVAGECAVALAASPPNSGSFANSASVVNIPKAADGGATFAQIVFYETVTAAQYIEIMWLPENVAVTLDFLAAGAIAPAVPSVILVAERIA